MAPTKESNHARDCHGCIDGHEVLLAWKLPVAQLVPQRCCTVDVLCAATQNELNGTGAKEAI